MLRAIRQPKSTENAPLLLAFSAAELPTQPGPPSPNIVQSWPRDEAQGRASWSGWRDAAAARPAASGASRRLRSSCRLLARPPGAPLASPAAPSRRLRAAALTAPAHKSRLPTPSLPPSPPVASSTSPTPLRRGQRFGASKDSPPLCPHRRRPPTPPRRSPRPRRRTPPARPWGPAPEHPRGVHVVRRRGAGGKGRRVPDPLADPGSCP